MKPNNKTQKLYTERAPLYERLFVGFLGWGRELESFFRGTKTICDNFKILDAGCGTGIITRVLYRIANEASYEGIKFHAFDLTQNMLEIFQQWVVEQGANNVEIQQADVLEIDALPSNWKEYDLIITSTMLEYLPKAKIQAALLNLKTLLKNGGRLLVIMTRRNMITQWLAGMWWRTNLYEQGEIQKFFADVGFQKIEVKDFSPNWSKFIMVIEGEK